MSYVSDYGAITHCGDLLGDEGRRYVYANAVRYVASSPDATVDEVRYRLMIFDQNAVQLEYLSRMLGSVRVVFAGRFRPGGDGGEVGEVQVEHLGLQLVSDYVESVAGTDGGA
ncbi:hypothetical protein LEP48_03085 [Isoptericola sp. NEAU-Y5]|uniref:Uncharacterized protein n=1 Tax=Isoptericola luteus TaxID=2879484 RepID=A0ABS7ZBD6_9MICO|nr:hypothetical protein [Isoptericola sp. NEAU-Y5]MCA5892335.1 hypothetical protein [Isoptericola sp. NEAU-Y5]